MFTNIRNRDVLYILQGPLILPEEKLNNLTYLKGEIILSFGDKII